jgi:pimeloyl-ACP methyl ester carboxylesterase
MSLRASETQDISQANATGRPPVVFVHGLWMLASSWQAWRSLFESVAIDSAPFRGVLPLPLSALKSARPVIATSPIWTGGFEGWDQMPERIWPRISTVLSAVSACRHSCSMTSR